MTHIYGKSLQWDRFLHGVIMMVALILMIGCKSGPKTAGQPVFASPTEAADMLTLAARNRDMDTITNILGPGSRDVVFSGDSNEDVQTIASFVAKYDRMHRWARMTDGSEVLFIGADNYPFPIPLAQNNDAAWTFDIAAGRTEILARRIGRNELLAMDACYTITRAQREYFHRVHDGRPAKQYAQLIPSNPGQRDGLYWKTVVSQAESPLGRMEAFANVEASSEARVEVDGYVFRILNAQGEKALGGSKSYLKDGKLTGGFAVIASPVKYGDSGIMTFMIGNDGVLLEKDLGQNTAAVAASIQSYNPDESWTPAS